MPVDDADVAKLRRMYSENGSAGDDLRALQSHTEVIAYLIAVARQSGKDEADAIELLVRASDMAREDTRKAERLLRKLGYVVVCDRLRELANWARKKPEPFWMSRLPLAPRHQNVS